ncbi:MAG: serine/threonine protein kinase [Myxococcales bacterium]|nr:serine/threonine protein kinase [Myxococcales bacterium]
MSSAGPLEKIGRYEVVAHLATGGMAEILLARLVGPAGFERAVVLKRILPHFAQKQSFVDMFLDEARIVAGIQHKNVVHVTDLGHTGEHLYLVMEYLEGENVAGIIRRSLSQKRRLPTWVPAFVIAEVCAGLHAAHELTDDTGRSLGLVHRDVSPQNVLVTYSGEVKLLDFGIAKVGARASPETEPGQLKGKVEYMSPEQARGRPLDRRSDIFATGIVLYELVSRRRLFNRPSVLSALEAICHETVLAPSQAAPDCPASLERVISRAINKDPGERYPTAAAMRQDLLSVTHELIGASDPGQGLASLMQEMFRDRLLEKREMLRQVRAGDRQLTVPNPEPDSSVDVPDLIVPQSAAPGLPPAPAFPGSTPAFPSSARAFPSSAPEPTLPSVAGLERPGQVRVPPPAPDHYDGSFADLEILVGEAIARFGMAGDAIVEGNRIRLVGAGPEVATELANVVEHWETLAPELRQRRAGELARRLVQARRAALEGGGQRTRVGIPRWLPPLLILAVGAAAIFAAFNYLAPGSRWSFGAPAPTATAISSDEYERQRVERAERVCQATRARIMRGATIGPTDVEGWVVELVLARPTEALTSDAKLAQFVSGTPARFVWKEAPEIEKQEGIGTSVSVATEALPGAVALHGVRLTFSGKYAIPYFYSGERRAYVKTANAMAESLGRRTARSTLAALSVRPITLGRGSSVQTRAPPPLRWSTGSARLPIRLR